jgi:hypothetical protein
MALLLNPKATEEPLDLILSQLCPSHGMKTYGGLEGYYHVFLISTLHGGERSTSRAGRYAPREIAFYTRWLEGWVGPRADQDVLESEKDFLGRLAHSLFLYLLSYPGPMYFIYVLFTYICIRCSTANTQNPTPYVEKNSGFKNWLY